MQKVCRESVEKRERASVEAGECESGSRKLPMRIRRTTAL